MVRRVAHGARRGGIFVAGTALVLAGLAMFVLPGPGLLVAGLGLAVLSTEFHWARRARDAVTARVRA